MRIVVSLKFAPFILIILLAACKAPRESDERKDPTLFRLLSSDQTGINFTNNLPYTEQLNTYTYKNFYSGAGVGLGDFNNDGLVDIYFAGNLVPGRLFLNKGALHFLDITKSSGLGEDVSWTTGVSIADINGDGLLDIYLCKSGPPGGLRRHNELFINQGDLTFKEEAEKYGIAFTGLSMHAAFFDFDKDGDLDCYLLNNSLRSVGGYDLRVGQRDTPDPLGGNKLLRNDDGHYTDITQAAGIYSSEIGFGLGVTIGDIDKDGWQDMYVSNDFFEKDYLYVNQRNGKFKECLEDYMQEISQGSMGADMADLNNDGLPEVFVTEMLPGNDARIKTTTQFESWNRYDQSVKSGYHRQFSRNVLQLNNGNGSFTEVARFSHVEATDWSWGALMFDMDNDGLKDIFVANGIFKELLNQDYVNFTSSPEVIRKIQQKSSGVLTELIDSIPSTPLSNYAFRNMDSLIFVNYADQWGLGELTFSNGSAYGDLDNDGDLDLVLNNANMPSMIYENRSREMQPENGYLTFTFEGERMNSSALGTKVTLKVKNQLFYQELSPMRGFMSTVDDRLLFGLGKNDHIDSVIVQWPNGTVTTLSHVNVNQQLSLKEADGKTLRTSPGAINQVFKTEELAGVDFVHRENDFSDFDRAPLIFNMVSNEGPCLCTGDVNGDGKTDFYIGGAKGQAGSLYIQRASGRFEQTNAKLFESDKDSEDTDCVFFDANGDEKDDLYVTSGGFEFSTSSTALLDRLYFNKGDGSLVRSAQALPVSGRFESTSTVVPADFDGDGDTDLFVGARLIPFMYGLPGSGFILKNDGKGNFSNATNTVAPALSDIGMITGAQWTDIDNDGDSDLIVVGEWMPIHIFINDKGVLKDESDSYGISKSEGWYNAIELGDFNSDGLVDFVVGNHGLNSRFRATEREPLSMYINDFDQNGTIEQIMTRFDNGVSYPLVLKPDLVSQLPYLKKKFLHFRDYRGMKISDIFDKSQIERSLILSATTLETAVWLNSGGRQFQKVSLPYESQYFPVYSLLVDDFNADGKLDILLGGNQYRAKPETGVYAGGRGLLLTGDGQGQFTIGSAEESGLNISGEIRSMKKIEGNGYAKIIVGRSNAGIAALRYKQNTDVKE